MPDPNEVLRDLRAYVEATGWAGWDPYDLRGHPVYLGLSRRARSGRFVDRALLHAAYLAEQRWPVALRRLLRIDPLINAKGMGLLARGYAILGAGGDAAAAEEARRRLAWLEEHRATGIAGVGWGYPFEWESRIRIPTGTPSAVVTATVADAFRTVREESLAGRLDHDVAHLDEVLQGTARFVAEDLSRTETEHGICFSYTPIDEFRVHNANLIAAELLLWAGRTYERLDWEALARRAFAYTLADLEPSGAWDYVGPPDRGTVKRMVDPYHQGFILRMLLRAHDLTDDPRYMDAARRGYAFFREHLFREGRPRATESRDYPVNVHSVAEGLLVFNAFRDVEPDAGPHADAALTWADTHMRDPDGFFHYLWSPGRVNRLPMMRWGQAWMFLALAHLATGRTPR